MYTILVVDDTPENLAILHESLYEAGYLVLVATSGESAFQILSNQHPDLILLDAIMPGLNGFDVADKLKSNPSTCNIPIIFMTGLTETENIVKAFNNGVIDYVTKPLNHQEVIARIATHIKASRESNHVKELLDEIDMATFSFDKRAKKINWASNKANNLLKDYLSTPSNNWLELFFDWALKVNFDEEGLDKTYIVAEKDAGKLYGYIKNLENNGDLVVLLLREENEALALRTLQQEFLLTMREAEVLYWLIKGKTNREIAAILGNSTRTIDKHVEHVFEKIGIENRNSAINLVIKNSKVSHLLK